MEITSLNPQLEKTSAAPVEVIKHIPNNRGLIIYETTNYDMFKNISGNRSLNLFNVRRIIESIDVNGYLTSVVIVNENMEVIDGQHRVEAARETGKPVLYVISQGYGVHQIQALNSNSKNWGREDYLNSYCELGIPVYLQIKAFREMYPTLSLTAILNILSLRLSNNTKRLEKGGEVREKKFEMGKFEIPNIELSVEIADHLAEFAEIYDGYNRTHFVAAIVHFMKNPNYSPSEMISKLKQQPTALVHCANTIQYKELLEKIYNYKRKASGRVSLAREYSK
jgi:hypothetical protein